MRLVCYRRLLLLLEELLLLMILLLLRVLLLLLIMLLLMIVLLRVLLLLKLLLLLLMINLHRKRLLHIWCINEVGTRHRIVHGATKLPHSRTISPSLRIHLWPLVKAWSVLRSRSQKNLSFLSATRADILFKVCLCLSCYWS